MQRQAELSGAQLEQHTVAEAFAKYADEVSPTKKGERWEVVRCTALARGDFGKLRMDTIKTPDLAKWRDQRLTEVGPASVRRELNLLRSVFVKAIREWHWMRDNPITGLDAPQSPPSRRRRITDDEASRMVLALGYDGGEPQNAMQRTALAFLFALETAMRSGEICGLTWANVSAKSVELPRSKNGDRREVPLSVGAREIIALLPKGRPTVFDLNNGSRDTFWRAAAKRAGVLNLHFHDSRSEAIWRLSKKLGVNETEKGGILRALI
jgi:integrase